MCQERVTSWTRLKFTAYKVEQLKILRDCTSYLENVKKAHVL